MKKRVLRLYPELWCAVVLSVLSIVILSDRFHIGELVLFAIGQATILQFWTPDSLRDFGCGTPNGSLASIFMIVQFYILVWYLKKKLKHGKVMWITLLAVSLMFNVASSVLSKVLPTMLYKLWDVSLLPYLWLFVMGAFVSEHFDDMMPIMRKFWYIGAILLLIQAFVGIDIPGEYGVIKTMLQCFAWIGFAYALPKWNIKKDISYGIFLYHMVVINVLIQLGYVGFYLYFVISCIVVCMLALLSSLFSKYLVKK